MHPYDPTRAPSHPSATSHTPIYDTLYSEYLRAFRALPGDRTGEEDLGFTAFSYGGGYGGGSPYSGGLSPSGPSSSNTFSYVSGWNGSAWQPADTWQQPSYTPQPAPSYAYAGQGAGAGPGYGGGRQHQTGMHHIPAALPPAPRRGY